MAMALEQLRRGFAVSGGLADYIGAMVSGGVDGFLVKKNLGMLFLVKNIAIPVLSAFKPGLLPRGVTLHSAGQLGMVVALALTR